MSDDRELVERLAAIDATPRASWVAELRADLDAAWETGDAGYLVSLRTTTLTLVDHEPTPSEPSSGRRWLILIVAAAAIVVAIAFVAARDHDTAPADQPSPTVTVPPTTPRALSATAGERLLPGTYYVDEIDDGTPTPARIFVTDRRRMDGETYHPPEHPSPDPRQARTARRREDAIGFITFSRPNRVYVDACHGADGFHPGPVTTLDGLTAALYEQGGWADVTAPSDITIDGHPGKMFQRTAPAVLSDCNKGSNRLSGQDANGPIPGGPALRSWLNEDDSNLGWAAYEPGQFESLVILDIDGTVVVINANLLCALVVRRFEHGLSRRRVGDVSGSSSTPGHWRRLAPSSPQYSTRSASTP